MTVETLRAIVHTPLDPIEEERKEQVQYYLQHKEKLMKQEKGREILTMYRERPLDEITVSYAKELEASDLSKTIQRLTKKNAEWNKLQEYGRTGMIKNIFELKLPSFVAL